MTKPQAISRLAHSQPAMAARIHRIMHDASAVEATLIGAETFPPLERRFSDILESANEFFGFAADGVLRGVWSYSGGMTAIR